MLQIVTTCPASGVSERDDDSSDFELDSLLGLDDLALDDDELVLTFFWTCRLFLLFVFLLSCDFDFDLAALRPLRVVSP